MKSSHAILAVVMVAILAIGTVAILSYEGEIKPPAHPNTGTTVHFTIIEADPPAALAGINGSYYKSPTVQWPVMHVHLGDTVVITVMNLNSSYEAHGLAIDHYLPSPGYTLYPGDKITFTFVANEAGYFRVYCSIECSIHPLMQNGALYVSSS